MVMQHETAFESPASYELGGFGSPETMFEWETQEASHLGGAYAAFEDESAFEDEAWEAYETDEVGSPYSAMESAYELGPSLEEEYPESSYEATFESPGYAAFEDEGVFEDEGIFEDEWSTEADPFIGRALRRGLSKLGQHALQRLAPLAQRLVPVAAGALGSMIPGAGVVAGPLAGKLAASLVSEGEMEAEQIEAQLFGVNEALPEIEETQQGHEAALTEELAYEAGQVESEDEAAALVSSTLPLTVMVMGAARIVRPVMPTLTQANARVARVLIAQGGRDGRRLLATMPRIQRRAVGIMRAAKRRGRPITGPLAVRAMQAATQRVLGDPGQVASAIERSTMLRRRVAPYNPRRVAASRRYRQFGY
jgi:hypothetical protein